MPDSSKPIFFDTHCHLDSSQYRGETDDVVRRAIESGVKKMVIIGINLENSIGSRDLAREYSQHFTTGIHPHDADVYKPGDVRQIAELARDELCVAIGEIGLDYFRDYADHDNQRKLLREMLAIASDLKLPVVLHQRAVGRDVIDILDEFDLPAGGVFHCFSDGMELAQEGLNRGFYISFAGNVTYKKSKLLEIAAEIPIDRLLIETDAPYLTPIPHRGKRNEPAMVALTGACIAEARGMDVQEFASITRDNGKRLFGI